MTFCAKVVLSDTPAEDLSVLLAGKVIATMFTSRSLEISNASFADSRWHRTLTIRVGRDRVKDQISS
jgi:hypothetical protein